MSLLSLSLVFPCRPVFEAKRKQGSSMYTGCLLPYIYKFLFTCTCTYSFIYFYLQYYYFCKSTMSVISKHYHLLCLGSV